jgi:acyl carrier protein
MTPSNPCTLTRDQVHTFLWHLVAKHTGKPRAQLDATTRLIHDLGTDSLGIVELNLELEETLGVGIPNELLDNPELTLGEVEAALVAKCS